MLREQVQIFSLETRQSLLKDDSLLDAQSWLGASKVHQLSVVSNNNWLFSRYSVSAPSPFKSSSAHVLSH